MFWRSVLDDPTEIILAHPSNLYWGGATQYPLAVSAQNSGQANDQSRSHCSSHGHSMLHDVSSCRFSFASTSAKPSYPFMHGPTYEAGAAQDHLPYLSHPRGHPEKSVALQDVLVGTLAKQQAHVKLAQAHKKPLSMVGAKESLRKYAGQLAYPKG